MHHMIRSQLRTLFDTQRDAVEAWLEEAREKALPFLTTSVDLRTSGTRLVPVDTNVYPAGFQNLSTNGRKRASEHFQSGIHTIAPLAKNVLVIPENHTRNLPYYENLATLRSLLQKAGFVVEFGNLQGPQTVETASGESIHQYGLIRSGNTLQTDSGFTPDAIVLNNDCSAGEPAVLQNLGQPVLPPTHMGWFQRRKSEHFRQYQRLCEAFAERFGLDAWTLCADFKAVEGVNFKTREGAEEVAQAVDELLAAAAKKHTQYGITQAPYAYVKADSGTYGMGILVVESGADILEMNKKERNKMHVVKEGMEVHHVIVQEGIPTIDVVDGKPAEPMIYLVDGVPVGGMFRLNATRDARNNLNASGMEFKGMCEELDATPCRQRVDPCDFSAYGLVAALAALSAAREECADVKTPLAATLAAG